MCGIAGIVGTVDPSGADMRRMLAALTHRGPDGEGIFADGRAILGHRRLSIIDLHGGRQPLHNVEKTLWLVCNGEIYNYQELRAELTAVLTHPYELVALLDRTPPPGHGAAGAVAAALTRVGDPYVWGAAGPTTFDCSGLVQWSFAEAGVTMPRVAADQARTGPAVPVSQLQPGDLLFYHTDPTDPGYISHVAIYLGDGKMVQAPETGENVEVVPADTGSEFAGAVRVDPALAAAVASSI